MATSSGHSRAAASKIACRQLYRSDGATLGGGSRSTTSRATVSGVGASRLCIGSVLHQEGQAIRVLLVGHERTRPPHPHLTASTCCGSTTCIFAKGGAK